MVKNFARDSVAKKASLGLELFNSKTRYAIDICVYIMENCQAGPVNIHQVAAETNLSVSYLEQIFSGLKKCGIVRSYKGPGGGYMLAKSADEIAVSKIVECFSSKSQSKSSQRMDPFWSEIDGLLLGLLSEINLGQVSSMNETILKDAAQGLLKS